MVCIRRTAQWAEDVTLKCVCAHECVCVGVSVLWYPCLSVLCVCVLVYVYVYM